MKKSVLFLLLIFALDLSAQFIDIEVPEIRFVKSDDGVVPVIESYELDGTGEKTVLPFREFTFSSKVIGVEMLESEVIELDDRLGTGKPLYRLNDMKKVVQIDQGRHGIPSVNDFVFYKNVTFSGTRPEHRISLYPVIPIGEKKVVFVKKMRVFTEKQDIVPKGPTKGRDTLLIITSELVVSRSKEFKNYLNTKRADGFKVKVVTEKDYGGGDLKGLKRVEKIRDYLREMSRDFYFLLIIADPDPTGSDVPMVVAIPDQIEETGYQTVPTDIFYAELTGPVDKNGNGIPGERGDLVDFAFEFVVGRIPVYGQNTDDLDKILLRTIDFIKEKPVNAAEYRERFLFPATIAYYPGQDGNFYLPKMDGGYVVEYIKESVIKEPFLSKTLVEHSGSNPSEFIDEEAINYDSVLKNWNDGYGAVYWMGHGMSTYSVRTIYNGDKNGNGYPDSYEMTSATFVDSEMTKKMTHTAPFVFMGSCLNGTISSNQNLGYSMLLNNSVGVVASSQVSYGSIFSDYNLGSQDIFAYGVVFIDALIDNKFPAQILQTKKQSWSDNSVLLTIKMETNYLGDPSLNLNISECESDSECDDGIFCNGTEVCNGGYCELNHDAIPCPAIDDPCRENICDEKTKECVKTDLRDGYYCGETENLCFEGMRCMSGECVATGAVDCSHIDSECEEGVCNSSTGLCERLSVNEGDDCDDNLFCTENEKCVGGQCVGTEKDLPDETRPCAKIECSNGKGDFVYLSDTSLNWTECSTAEGKKGTCYYGVCQPLENSGDEGSESGCGILLL